MLKTIILAVLEWQVKRFFKKNRPKLVAVAGSVGKTSTKLAIATVLSQRYKVLVHEGNYNSEVSVPLAVLEIPVPEELKNPLTWLSILWQAQQKVHQPFAYEVIVLELGTDHPGDIARFGKYLRPDIAVVTAVAPEHMEYFKTIDAVAQEELAAANFAQSALINRDDIDGIFARFMTNPHIDTYGTSGVAEYRYSIENFEVPQGFRGKFVSPEYGEQPVALQLLGEHSVKAAVAAGAVGVKLGLSAAQIVTGMQAIQPVKGRMQLLRGLEASTIIDDTYNSSPKAAIAALQTLYTFPAKQKIAILGSMNELGDFSKAAHEQVGQACDPSLLDWVITIGDEAEKYLAPAAAGRGCQVRSFKSPYLAGGFAHSVLHPGAVILAKGSQNRVFAEEAVKVLLHNTDDEQHLVRQTPGWLVIKQQQFDQQ